MTLTKILFVCLLLELPCPSSCCTVYFTATTIETYRTRCWLWNFFNCNKYRYVYSVESKCCAGWTGKNCEEKKVFLPDYHINEVDIDSKQMIDAFGEPVLSFICRFHTVPKHLYKVQWLIDDMTIKETGPAEAVDQDAFILTDDDIYGIYGPGFFFDMKIQCSVSVFDNDLNALVKPLLSEEFYPIQLPVNHVSFQRGDDGTLSLKNNIPFECTGGNEICEMGIQIYDPSDSYDCKDSTIALKHEDSSGGKVTTTSTKPAVKGTEIRKVITSKNNDKYKLRKDFELNIVVVFRGTGKSFWSSLLKTKVHVEIYDRLFWVGQNCYLHVDPHSKSMDGLKYENQNVDMFVLLRHKLLPIEIQTMTVPCWTRRRRWSPKCSCAIVIRAGADVFLINHCDNKHFTGFLSAVDKLIKVYERYDTRYKIILPNTMMIGVNVIHYRGYFMNIDIYPSPSEMNNIEGLCGNFNGDKGDDLMIRETVVQGNNNEFSLSWGLLSTDRWSESLLNQINYQNPTPWSPGEKLCVWPKAATTYSDPICSADEAETCTKPKIHKGRKLRTYTRHKWDASKINPDIERRLERLRIFIFEQHAIHRRKREVAENVMNETYARSLCEEAFLSCPVSNIIGKPVQEDTYLDDCAKDVAASGNIDWAIPHCNALTARNEVALEKDVFYATKNKKVVFEMNKICFGNCNGHGTCLAGVCHCEEGWAPPSCLLNFGKPVTITYITGNGQCDLSEDTCDEVVLETDGLVAEPQAKVDIRQAGIDGTFKSVDKFTKQASRISFNEAVVSLNSGRYRRSTTSNTVLAIQYGISVSNDGINFGNITFVTVLDTRCQETNSGIHGEEIVLLKAGFCYIDGICYSDGTENVINACKICRPTMDLYEWTEENCLTVSSDTVLPTYLIVITVIGAVLVIGFISGLVFRRFASKRRPTSSLPDTLQ